MKIKLKTPLSIDSLTEILSEEFESFSDEKHRVIDIKLFFPIFVYKYGGLNDFCFFLDKRRGLSYESKDEYVLVCESFGFRYCFPVFKRQ